MSQHLPNFGYIPKGKKGRRRMLLTRTPRKPETQRPKLVRLQKPNSSGHGDGNGNEPQRSGLSGRPLSSVLAPKPLGTKRLRGRLRTNDGRHELFLSFVSASFTVHLHQLRCFTDAFHDIPRRHHCFSDACRGGGDASSPTKGEGKRTAHRTERKKKRMKMDARGQGGVDG